MKKLVDILRRLFRGAKSLDAGELYEAIGEAGALLALLDDLPEDSRKVINEGRDVITELVPILASYARDAQGPTRAQKAKLQSELFEFTTAMGALINTLPTRD